MNGRTNLTCEFSYSFSVNSSGFSVIAYDIAALDGNYFQKTKAKSILYNTSIELAKVDVILFMFLILHFIFTWSITWLAFKDIPLISFQHHRPCATVMMSPILKLDVCCCISSCTNFMIRFWLSWQEWLLLFLLVQQLPALQQLVLNLNGNERLFKFTLL